jgi:hypothetical protein
MTQGTLALKLSGLAEGAAIGAAAAARITTASDDAAAAHELADLVCSSPDVARRVAAAPAPPGGGGGALGLLASVLDDPAAAAPAKRAALRALTAMIRGGPAAAARVEDAALPSLVHALQDDFARAGAAAALCALCALGQETLTHRIAETEGAATGLVGALVADPRDAAAAVALSHVAALDGRLIGRAIAATPGGAAGLAAALASGCPGAAEGIEACLATIGEASPDLWRQFAACEGALPALTRRLFDRAPADDDARPLWLLRHTATHAKRLGGAGADAGRAAASAVAAKHLLARESQEQALAQLVLSQAYLDAPPWVVAALRHMAAEIEALRGRLAELGGASDDGAAI